MLLKSNFKIIFIILCLLTHIACNQEVIERVMNSPSSEELPEDPQVTVDGEEIDEIKESIEPEQPPIIEEIEAIEDIEADELGIEYGNSGKPAKSQKGPFYMDSDVYIQEIIIEDNDFVYSGEIYIDKVIDDLGSFMFPNRLRSPYVDIRVNGYYFNEITGLPSDSVISLGSYSYLADDKIPNINILTTLAQKRIRNLIKNDQLGFEEAEIQAKEEVLRIFHIDEEIKNFDELNIEGNSSGDAALLAISLILQGNLNTGQLSNFIATIREDLSDNGIVDAEVIHDQICEQTRSLDPITIRENLNQFYQSIDREDITIPFFENYLDSDCNGVINKNDPKSFIFFNIKVNPDLFDERADYTIYPFQDQLWIMGAHLPHLKKSSNFIDLEDFESRDFNYLHSPIMFTLEGNLLLLGGWQAIDVGGLFPPECGLIQPINSLGYYFINNELGINEIINPYFNHRGDDLEANYRSYVRFINNSWDFLEEDYLHFSVDSHELLHHENKVYLIKKDISLPRHQFSCPLRSQPYSKVLEPGLEWGDDEIAFYIDRWSEFYFDIISFNNEIYILANDDIPTNLPVDEEDVMRPDPNPENLEEEIVEEFNPESFRIPSNNEDELIGPDDHGGLNWNADTYSVKLIKFDPSLRENGFEEKKVFTINTYEYYHYKEQYFTLYKDILIVTNGNTSLMSYSNDGETWRDIHHPYRSSAEPGSKQNYIYHEPIVFRNMIHLIGGSQYPKPEYNGVVYGYFRNYYNYIRQMDLL